MTICAMRLMINCSKTAINNDLVIGIGTKNELSITSKNSKSKIEFDWIFNDDYLGRHHQYLNNNLILQTDFRWKNENDIYTISDPGTDFPEEKVKLNSTTLQNIDGVFLLLEKNKKSFYTKDTYFT
jgi:hypothetical protein